MRALLLFISAIAIISASDFSKDTFNGFELYVELVDGAKNFTNGFIVGLQKSPTPLSKCYNAIQKVEAQIANIDRTGVACLFLHFEYCAMLNSTIEVAETLLAAAKADCSYDTFVQKIQSLQDPAGYAQVATRFVMYQKPIVQKLEATKKAFEAGDFYSAGSDLGYIVRVLLDFKVTSPALGEETHATDPLSLTSKLP